MDPVVVKFNEVEAKSLPGTEHENAGWIRRVIYPPNVITKGSFFGVAEVKPDFSPHRWHSHVKDCAAGYEVVYPKDFEEIYHIISGSGVVQWRTADGAVKEQKVGAGDTIFFPVGVSEHQLFNDGKQKIRLIFCGSPTASVTFK